MRVLERMKSFLTRAIIYEENGVVKTFEAPANVPYDAFVAAFEKEKGVKYDPETGICEPVETKGEENVSDETDR